LSAPAPTNYNRTRKGPVFLWAPLTKACRPAPRSLRTGPARPSLLLFGYLGKATMAWTTPTLVEICIGLEINGYLPAEF
jgi:coenzyme PQQ precursor peptide PqqA